MREELFSTPIADVSEGAVKLQQSSLRNIHECADTGTCSNDASVKLIVETSDNEEDDAPSRSSLSPAQILARVLDARRHLDLTDQVYVERAAIRMKYGGAADVYEGHFINTAMKVAVKSLRLNMNADERIAKNIAKEIRIWSELKHPNVLPLLGYLVEGNYPSLVSEWVVNGSLREYMPEMNKADSLKMMLGIARGLAYIHNMNAIHSDVKSDNILVSSDRQALLTDFGISRMDALSAGYTTASIRGSVRWQAYEFFDLKNDGSLSPSHTFKTDVWAFGMTVYELLTHQLPYYHIHDNTQVILHISRGRLPKEPSFSSNPNDAKIERYMWSLCGRSWEKDPNLRPTMKSLENDIQSARRTEGLP